MRESRPADGLLMRMKDDQWDAVLNINLKGTFLFSRVAHSARRL